MADPAVLSALCLKLGHGLEEVRMRALDSILCKLDRGFLEIGDLIRTKDFLVKLLEWFGLQPCPAQERVLGLILNLLKQEGSGQLIKQIGAQRFLLALNAIRESLPSDLCPLLDDIAGLVNRSQVVQELSESGSNLDQQTAGAQRLPEDDFATFPRSVGNVGFLDASLQDALQVNLGPCDDSVDQLLNLCEQDHLETPVSSNVLKHILLPWQPLVSTDRHVLIAVEGSLVNTVDRAQLLNTCSFLTDVMMRDFPAEVFLQRPAIVMTFMKLLKSSLISDDNYLSRMVISCLLTLTNALLSRLRYYQDPNMANQKQESFLHHEDENGSQTSVESFLSNFVDQADVEALKRVPEWNEYVHKPTDSQASSRASSRSQSFPDDNGSVQRSHNGTQVPSESSASEESSVLRLHQCSLPQYSLISMQYVLPHVDSQSESTTLLYKLSCLLTNCVTPQIWLAPASDRVATDIATHLFEVLEKLGETLLIERSQTSSRLTHLQLLAITRHLLHCLVPLEIADRSLPRQMKQALCSTLLDGSLHAFFPSLHTDLRQYSQTFKNVRDADCVKLFESTLSVAESLNSAAKLLTQEDLSDGSKVVLNTECALVSLAFHQDYRFIPLVFDTCSKNYHRWHLTESENTTLTCILLKLLAHADLIVKRTTYSHLHKQVLDSLSVQHPHQSPAESLAFLLFNTQLLLEITTHGIASADDLIQNYAEDIMLHALKGRFLLGTAHWTQFLSSLEPVLPLLQCWSDKPTALGRSIITMLNPDVGSQMSLGSDELLKGNLRLLFSKDDFVRGEALSRLIWLLTKEEDAFNKLPHIATLHNCASDRICLVEKPVDVFHNIPEELFYQESSLVQVFDIVESSDLEPRMLLSAVTQLAAMLEDPRHHETFLSRAGLSLSIEYLHAAVFDKRFEVYPEVVVPVVSILRSLSLHNSVTRHQLSKNISIFYSVLRGLIMFPSDVRLRINASQLLAVLLYNDVIISASPRSLSDGFVIRGLSVPHLIEARMNLPIVFSTHWRASHYTEPLMTDVLLRNEECRIFLATAWNLSYFKGEQSPLLWSAKNLPPKVPVALKNFSSALLLNKKNLQILQASAILNVCQKQLICIQEAATHVDVINSLDILKSVIALYNMIKETHLLVLKAPSDVLHFKNVYKDLSWRQTFRRFLMAAPASVEDQALLVQILQFLKAHVSISSSLGLNDKEARWLSKLLQHPSQPLPNLFHTVAHTGYAGDNEMPQALSHLPKWKDLCKELLKVITEFSNFEYCILERMDSGSAAKNNKADAQEENKENRGRVQKSKKNKNLKSVHSSKRGSGSELERAEGWVDELVSSVPDEKQSSQNTSWTHVIQNIVSCLKSSDTQHFYNLAYLNWLLWALTHLTSKEGWSTALRRSELISHFSEMLGVLVELVQAFHLECGKGGSSYMGLSITRASILCLFHLLEEMQQYQDLKWEDFWHRAARAEFKTAFYVPWLPSLFQSREPVVRAAALQVAAGVALSPQGCENVTSMLVDHPDIWMTPLCILLDRTEASAVREQAANLLTNLAKCRIDSKSHGDNGLEDAAFEVMLQRISEESFLTEVWAMFGSLSLATCWEPYHNISGDVGVGLMHWSLLENDSENVHLCSNQYILVNKSSPDQHLNHVPSTPALIRSLCSFLSAVGDMSHDTLNTLAKAGLSEQLLRCISAVPPIDSGNKRAFQLYCDSLRMYASVCHLVSQCISYNIASCHYIFQQPHTFHKLLMLLDPTLFYVDSPPMLSLRNNLWTEVLWLISTLITMPSENGSCGEQDGHSVFHSLLIRSRGEPLASVLTIALSGSMLTELQRAAMACVESLLSHPASATGQPFAVLLDDLDADFNSSVVVAQQANMDDSIGASLCRSLLALYDVHSLRMGSVEKHHPGSPDWQLHRVAVAGALSAVLEASVSAKAVALNQGLVELLCAQLGAVQSHLVLEPGETMKRLSTKKKICPVLLDVDLLLGLLNSLIIQNIQAKELASNVGVTDTIHKLWMWCQAQSKLLLTVLRFLATLTSGCTAACHSLVLTTSVPGLGLRRTPSSQSLLHALVGLVLQETEASSGSHDLTILTIASNILGNACFVPECRTAITKGNLLRGIRHLHAGLSKKSKTKKHVETIWLRLLLQLSAYQEGQVILPKVPDFLEYLLHLSERQNKNNKLALQILRNIAFSPINRPRLLGSGEFLLLINKKIRDGDTDEQVAAAASLWALVANNQKGKLTAKCVGTDVQILDSLRQLAVCQKPGADFVAQLMNCVLKIVRHEPGKSVTS